MEDAIKKECSNCKNCTGTGDSVNYRIKGENPASEYITINCKIHEYLKFPTGSIPTCNKWDERDPTLADLRDEVRDLKKQVRDLKKKKCCDARWITDSWKWCCHDCRKCRCNQYYPPVTVWTTTGSNNTYTTNGNVSWAYK